MRSWVLCCKYHYLFKCSFLSYYNIRKLLLMRSLIAQLKSEKPGSVSAWVKYLCWFSLMERLEKGKIKSPSPYLTLIYFKVGDDLIILSQYLLDTYHMQRQNNRTRGDKIVSALSGLSRSSREWSTLITFEQSIRSEESVTRQRRGTAVQVTA